MWEPARLNDPLAGGKVCRVCGTRFSSDDAAFCPYDGEPLVPEGRGARLRDPLIGTVVDGRYEVESILGEGGMGTVYRVSHRVLGKPFALKVLRRDLSRETELGLRFLREAQAAASISHPNVIQITDFGTLPTGQSYFVMELLNGTQLSRIIRKGGPIPAARAVRLLRQILDGLSAAHRAGVIHRDLKPDNVFVGASADGEDSVRVLDFGLARIAGQSRLTKQGLVFGTPHYMSPEQASGGTVDQRTDIYALGVVMYEMFTGKVPFEADTFMGVLTKHLYVEPTPPSVVLGGTRELGALEQVTLRCLEKKPERRFSTVEAIAEELDRIATWSAEGALRLAPVEPGERREVTALADELELPAATEVASARRRAEGRLSDLPPWVWGVSGFAIVSVLGLAYLVARPVPRPRPVAVSALPAPVAPPAVPAALPVGSRGGPIRPVAVAAGAVSARATEGLPVSADGGELVRSRPAAKAERKRGAARPASPRRPSAGPPENGEDLPAKTSTGKEKMVGSEIVDPWSR